MINQGKGKKMKILVLGKSLYFGDPSGFALLVQSTNNNKPRIHLTFVFSQLEHLPSYHHRNLNSTLILFTAFSPNRLPWAVKSLPTISQLRKEKNWRHESPTFHSTTPSLHFIFCSLFLFSLFADATEEVSCHAPSRFLTYTHLQGLLRSHSCR